MRTALLLHPSVGTVLLVFVFVVQRKVGDDGGFVIDRWWSVAGLCDSERLGRGVMVPCRSMSASVV